MAVERFIEKFQRHQAWMILSLTSWVHIRAAQFRSVLSNLNLALAIDSEFYT